MLQRNTGLCSTTKNGTINRLTTVAAAGKPPRRIAFPQRQKQRFVQPGRLSTPTPIHRGKPRGPPPPPGSETGVDAVNVRKLLEEKQQQEGSDEARRQRHATLETSTSGRSGGVRSKRVAIQQQQRGNGVASNGAGGTKGFGGDGLPLPTNAKGWQVCVVVRGCSLLSRAGGGGGVFNGNTCVCGMVLCTLHHHHYHPITQPPPPSHYTTTTICTLP